MYQPQGHAVVRPRFYLPSPPPFSFSRRFLFNLVYWWIQVWFSPVIFLVKLIYSKLAPYAIPPVEFLWRNKFNFLKAGILAVFYFITTLIFAVVTYYILRSFFIVKEHSHDSLYFDFNAPLPMATVKFNSDSLVHGQPYNAIIELELPESPPNIDVGMFMITLQIFSDDYNGSSSLILESSRPCMLRYKTELLRTVHALSFSLPSLVGLYEQKQNLDVSLAENFMPSQTYDTVRAVVVLSKPNVQLYSSTLHIRASLSWLSYFVLRWPISSFLFGTTLCAAFHAPWLGILFLLAYLRIASHAERVLPVQPFVREDAAALRERTERELALRARMDREAHQRTERERERERMGQDVALLRAEHERTDREAALRASQSPSPRGVDVWGILPEVEQDDEEEEKREIEEELKRRLAERKREMEEEEKGREGERTKEVESGEESRRSSGSEGSGESSSGEWIDVNKEESEDDEEGSASGLRRRNR